MADDERGCVPSAESNGFRGIPRADGSDLVPSTKPRKGESVPGNDVATALPNVKQARTIRMKTVLDLETKAITCKLRQQYNLCPEETPNATQVPVPT
jgi:hypothetical protein